MRNCSSETNRFVAVAPVAAHHKKERSDWIAKRLRTTPRYNVVSSAFSLSMASLLTNTTNQERKLLTSIVVNISGCFVFRASPSIRTLSSNAFTHFAAAGVADCCAFL